jgi:hypothetical protein
MISKILGCFSKSHVWEALEMVDLLSFIFLISAFMCQHLTFLGIIYFSVFLSETHFPSARLKATLRKLLKFFKSFLDTIIFSPSSIHCSVLELKINLQNQILKKKKALHSR